jgi:hypothetical protein
VAAGGLPPQAHPPAEEDDRLLLIRETGISPGTPALDPLQVVLPGGCKGLDEHCGLVPEFDKLLRLLFCAREPRLTGLT